MVTVEKQTGPVISTTKCTDLVFVGVHRCVYLGAHVCVCVYVSVCVCVMY